ncbi:hypothetical protein A3F00_03265 [Candidatus Daviesbacteria bacterium RIFCSPHIGHO2_12_FULL_37_11]|uniref:Uncharacterized protein n=1 Tax=Candidatus Daviesbacteria bacterium RIFCSPHIGHO2_12_FULL_37_11 TaxID=1797777 RepID=A0A1F5KA59_9BACT|nr:MAG: hypothetical protein A3F00_03265 [Candidatus Daviesbacteria bacterium RIFCSPHIGHO2_12_FULL_37_11]
MQELLPEKLSDNDEIVLPSEAQKMALSIREQVELLDFLTNKGQFDSITEELFPNLPKTTLGTAKFFATCYLINSLLQAREITPFDELKTRLGTAISDLINVRDHNLFESLEAIQGEPDEDLIAYTNVFNQPVDQNQALELAIKLGLTDELDGRNFHALRVISDIELSRIRARAVRFKIDDLREQSESLKHTGFNSESDDLELKKFLEEEIRRLEEQRSILLREYLAGIETQT